MMGFLLLFSLAATDILIGVASIGIFWPIFAVAVLRDVLAGRLKTRWTSDSRLLAAALVMMFGAALVGGNARPETLAYAALFSIYGLWLTSHVDAFTPQSTATAMKAILIAYFITSLLAALLIFAGQLEFKEFLLARIYIQENTGEARPLAFSSEPSYAAFVVALAWLALVRLTTLGPAPTTRLLPWTLLTLGSLAMLGSIYGYLLTLIVVATSVSRLPSRIRGRVVLGAALLLLAVYMAGDTFDDDSRTLRIFNAVISGDLEEWLVVDTSSFFRFGPFLTYILSADFGSLQTWIGHGTATAGVYFVDLFRDHVIKTQDSVELGFIPAFLYDYGLVAAFAFTAFLYKTTRGPHRIAMFSTLLLLLFNANFSTQLIWFAVTCGLLSRDAGSPLKAQS